MKIGIVFAAFMLMVTFASAQVPVSASAFDAPQPASTQSNVISQSPSQGSVKKEVIATMTSNAFEESQIIRVDNGNIPASEGKQQPQKVESSAILPKVGKGEEK